MYILNRFYSERTWSTKRLFKLESLIQRLRSVPTDCSNDLVHLPHFISLQRGSETIDCIKFAARYYIIDYSKLTSAVAGLVCQHQSAFFSRFAMSIDLLAKVIEEHGVNSDEFTYALRPAVHNSFSKPISEIPDDLLKARWDSLIEASKCVRDLRICNK